MEVLEVLESPEKHLWAVMKIQCEIDITDSFFDEMVQYVKDVYGQSAIDRILADLLQADEDLEFDLGALTKAIQLRVPDPASEGKKPSQLTNYRSEAAELVARKALGTCYRVEFPVAAQLVKGNANQPILGFDGWGLFEEDGNYSLVLIQVKGSEDTKSPPSVAEELISEGKKCTLDLSALGSALMTLVVLINDKALQLVILRMLEKLGNGSLPSIFIAPVIIRGNLEARISDLESLIENAESYLPAMSRGLTASLGVPLGDFGRTLFERARANDNPA